MGRVSRIARLRKPRDGRLRLMSALGHRDHLGGGHLVTVILAVCGSIQVILHHVPHAGIHGCVPAAFTAVGAALNAVDDFTVRGESRRRQRQHNGGGQNQGENRFARVISGFLGCVTGDFRRLERRPLPLPSPAPAFPDAAFRHGNLPSTGRSPLTVQEVPRPSPKGSWCSQDTPPGAGALILTRPQPEANHAIVLDSLPPKKTRPFRGRVSAFFVRPLRPRRQQSPWPAPARSARLGPRYSGGCRRPCRCHCRPSSSRPAPAWCRGARTCRGAGR